jgi:hypothetical protein
MNRTTLCMLWLAGFALVTASCSQSTPGTGGNGGATSFGGDTSSGGSTPSGSGGSSNSGGATTSSGGSMASAGGTETSAGGTTPNAGGTTTSPGGTTPNAGGAPSSGGVARTGGSGSGPGGTTTSSGGTTPSLGGTASAGGTAASGGAPRTGGTTTSAGGTSAAGGTTTGSGGGTGSTVDPNNVVPWMNGYMWVGTCSDGTATGLDCPLFGVGSTTCPNPNATDFNTRGMFRTITQTIGGTASTKYTITFEARGVLGTKCYTGGTKQVPALSADPETSNDGWYKGGTPTDSKWNTYEIHVSPAVAGSGAANPLNAAEDIYYLNAFPYPPVTYGNDTYCEAHETFPMKYTASFPVMGGGAMKLVVHDSNCLGQMNCGGPDRQTTCAHPRTMDLTGLTPQPPTQTNFSSMQQPYKQTNGFYPQWVFFNVKSVL